MSLDVRTENLRVKYGNATAVRGADIAFDGGSVTALLGPNGAGKSSLLLSIYGSVPSTGKIVLDGEDIAGLNPTARSRRGLAIVPQGRQLFPTLTVQDNLSVMSQALKLPSERTDAAMERFPILRTRAKSLAGVLSGGEQQMLVVARALMSDPRVLLMDEPATGLAPIIVEQIMEITTQLADDGVAVLVAAPEIGALSPMIDRGYVMIRGEVGSADEEGGSLLNERYQSAMGIDRAPTTEK